MGGAQPARAAPEAPEDDAARREAATRRGVEAYRQGDYTAASAAFTTAYDLTLEMGSRRERELRGSLLGSLRSSLRAQAQRDRDPEPLCRLRHYQREYLEAWLLAEPELRRGQVESLLAQMAEVDAELRVHARGGRDVCDAPAAASTSPRGAAAPQERAAPVVRPAAMAPTRPVWRQADERSQRGWRIAGWTVMGLGVGLLGGGMGSALLLRHAHYRALRRLEDVASTQPNGLTPEQIVEARYAHDRGEAMKVPAIVSGVIGALLVATGAALLGRGRTRTRLAAGTRGAWPRGSL